MAALVEPSVEMVSTVLPLVVTVAGRKLQVMPPVFAGQLKLTVPV